MIPFLSRNVCNFDNVIVRTLAIIHQLHHKRIIGSYLQSCTPHLPVRKQEFREPFTPHFPISTGKESIRGISREKDAGDWLYAQVQCTGRDPGRGNAAGSIGIQLFRPAFYTNPKRFHTGKIPRNNFWM
jgi:hypothetical protein